MDEVWDGVRHVPPMVSSEHATIVAEVIALLRPRATGRLWVGGAFNLGDKDDYRVPDAGWFAAPVAGTYAATAVAVLEVLSPRRRDVRQVRLLRLSRCAGNPGSPPARAVGGMLDVDPWAVEAGQRQRGLRGVHAHARSRSRLAPRQPSLAS